MLDKTDIRSGDIVRGLLSRRRYRVIAVYGDHVSAVPSRLRRFRSDRLYWIHVDCLEVVK